MADCALLDRGLQRQRRVFRGMEPLFRVHYACEWVGEDGGGASPGLTRPVSAIDLLAIVVRRRVPATFSVDLELMES